MVFNLPIQSHQPPGRRRLGAEVVLPLVDSLFDQLRVRTVGVLCSYYLSSAINGSLKGISREVRDLGGINKDQLDLLLVDDQTVIELTKVRRSQLPYTVLLSEDTARVSKSRELLPDMKCVSRVFHWQGNPRVIDSIVKLREHEKLARVDRSACIIVLVEDEPFWFSTILPVLQSKFGDKALILLAETFEDFQKIARRYKKKIIGVITDLRLPRNGVHDNRVGLDVIDAIKEFDRETPVLLQTMGDWAQEEARIRGASFVRKSDPRLLETMASFIDQFFGFGDFIFRMPDGGEIARAKDIGELFRRIGEVPIECLCYHARRDHFSTWLIIHGHSRLAAELKPLRPKNEFDEHLRNKILETPMRFVEEIVG